MEAHFAWKKPFVEAVKIINILLCFYFTDYRTLDHKVTHQQQKQNTLLTVRDNILLSPSIVYRQFTVYCL